MITRVKIQNYRCFRSLDINFQEGVNLLVGGNESGKSTLLEAITLAITGRVRGRWAQDDLHPFWFNREVVRNFFEQYKTQPTTEPPIITIEVFIDSTEPQLVRQLQGANNTEKNDSLGLRIEVALDSIYQSEFVQYMQAEGGLGLLPTDLFEVRWSSFRSPDRITRKPQGLSLAQVDSRTIASSHSIDYYTRQLLIENIPSSDRAQLSTSLRLARSRLGQQHLASINEELGRSNQAPHNLGVHLDQTTASSWEASVAPQVDGVPLALSGQAQQAFAKIELAMLKKSGQLGIILVEEPENHLSQTRLRQLIDRLSELSDGRQIIVTTHSTFVLNRLGLDKLRLINANNAAPFKALDKDDVEFFRKLPNFETLRLVTAKKVVLVEGPSDQLYFESAFEKITAKSTAEHEVDVISIGGTSFRRWFALAKLLDKKAVGIRDNDGKTVDHWRSSYKRDMGPSASLHVGDPTMGRTLEPQIISANMASKSLLRQALGLTNNEDLGIWMDANKTESAVRIATSTSGHSFPQYIIDAVEELRD